MASPFFLSEDDWKQIIWWMVNQNKITNNNNVSKNLKYYLMTFLAHFMFQDSAFNIFDTKQFKPESTSNINEVHFYELNTMTVPQSYILKATYDYLQEVQRIITDTLDEDLKNTANIVISFISPKESEFKYPIPSKAFNPKPDKFNSYFLEEKENIYSYFQSKTKIKMDFLAGFVPLLQELQQLKEVHLGGK